MLTILCQKKNFARLYENTGNVYGANKLLFSLKNAEKSRLDFKKSFEEILKIERNPSRMGNLEQFMSGGEIFGEAVGRKPSQSNREKSDFSSHITRQFSRNLKYDYPGFDAFDKNNSGNISKREWLKVFRPGIKYSDFYDILAGISQQICQDPRPNPLVFQRK